MTLLPPVGLAYTRSGSDLTTLVPLPLSSIPSASSRAAAAAHRLLVPQPPPELILPILHPFSIASSSSSSPLPHLPHPHPHPPIPVEAAAMSYGSYSGERSVPPTTTNWQSGFLLVDCPSCGREKLLELKSKIKTNPGRSFVKCPKNQVNERNSCNFFMWFDQYEEYLVQNGLLAVENTRTDFGSMGYFSSQAVARIAECDANTKNLIRLVEKMVLINAVIAVLVALVVLVVAVK